MGLQTVVNLSSHSRILASTGKARQAASQSDLSRHGGTRKADSAVPTTPCAHKQCNHLQGFRTKTSASRLPIPSAAFPANSNCPANPGIFAQGSVRRIIGVTIRASEGYRYRVVVAFTGWLRAQAAGNDVQSEPLDDLRDTHFQICIGTTQRGDFECARKLETLIGPLRLDVVNIAHDQPPPVAGTSVVAGLSSLSNHSLTPSYMRVKKPPSTASSSKTIGRSTKVLPSNWTFRLPTA